MARSNLAETLERVTPDQVEKPRLALVSRETADEFREVEEKHWFADNVDTLIMTVGLAAVIFGYAVFGILVVAGR